LINATGVVVYKMNKYDIFDAKEFFEFYWQWAKVLLLAVLFGWFLS